MQYVIGEIFVGLGIAAIAGLVVGWFMKSLFSGGARSANTEMASSLSREPASDATLDMTSALADRDIEVEKLTLELHQLRGRDVTLQAGLDNQVEEINQVRSELTDAREALDANRAEFSAFRSTKQEEIEHLGNQLVALKAGTPAHDERLNEASETISALRSAVRENDRIIETLRARVHEGENSVESLRNQLATSERGSTNSAKLLRERENQYTELKKRLQETSGKLDHVVQELKNAKAKRAEEVARNKSSAQILSKSNADYKARQQQAEQATEEARKALIELENRAAQADAKLSEQQNTLQQLEASESTLRKQIEQRDIEISMLDEQLKSANSALQNANAELRGASESRKMFEDKSAEVAALTDMLQAAGDKRQALETDIARLSRQSADHDVATQTLAENKKQINRLQNELDNANASRESLSTQLVELQEMRNKETEEHAKAVTAIRKASNDESAEINQKAQRALVERNSAMEALQREFDAVVAKRDDYEEQITALQTRFRELDTDTQKRIGEIQSSLNETQNEARNKLQKAASEQIRLEKELKDAQAAQTDYQQQLQQLEQSKTREAAANAKVRELQQLLKRADDQARQRSTTIDQQSRESEQLKAELSKLRTLERELAEQKITFQQQRSAQASVQARLGDITGKRETAERELAQSTQKIQALTSQVSQLQPLESQLAEQQQQVVQRDQQLSHQQQLLQDIESKLANSQATQQKYETEIAKLRTDLNTQTQRAQKVEALQKALDESQRQANSGQQTVNELQSHIKSTKTELASATSELQKQRQQLAEQRSIAAKVGTLETQLKARSEGLSNSEAKIKRLSAQLVDADRIKLQLAESNTTVQRLQSSVDELSGDIVHKQEVEQHRSRAEQLQKNLNDSEEHLRVMQEKTVQLSQSLQQREQQYSNLDQEFQQQRTMIQKMEQQSEATLNLNKKLADQATEIESLREQLFSAQNTRSELRTDAALHSQNMAKLERTLTAKDTEIARLTARLTESDLQPPPQQISTAAQQDSTELGATIQALKLQVAEKDRQANEIQNRFAQLQLEFSQHKQRTAEPTAAPQLAELQTRSKSLEDDVTRWQQRALTAEQNLKQTEKSTQAHRQSNAQLQQYQNKLTAAEQQIQKLESENRDMQTTIASAQAAAAKTAAARPAQSQTKPRVFVQQSATSLPDSIGYETPTAHNASLSAGRDNLTILPGIDRDIENRLNRAGVSEFQQIALWSKREIVHYAERVGLTPTDENTHKWPAAARQVLEERQMETTTRH